jgi:hypothetical protein
MGVSEADVERRIGEQQQIQGPHSVNFETETLHAACCSAINGINTVRATTIRQVDCLLICLFLPPVRHIVMTQQQSVLFEFVLLILICSSGLGNLLTPAESREHSINEKTPLGATFGSRVEYRRVDVLALLQRELKNGGLNIKGAAWPERRNLGSSFAPLPRRHSSVCCLAFLLFVKGPSVHSGRWGIANYLNFCMPF